MAPVSSVPGSPAHLPLLWALNAWRPCTQDWQMKRRTAGFLGTPRVQGLKTVNPS